MAEFSDLSPYNCIEPTPDEIELNIGWINTEKEFPKGSASTEFIHHLWNFCRRAFMQTRGLYECDGCSKGRTPIIKDRVRLDKYHVFTHFREEKTLGSAEIRVFGENGIIYCAPDLVFHYVRDHRYRPPDAFIEAIINGPHPGSKEYYKLALDYDCRDKWMNRL